MIMAEELPPILRAMSMSQERHLVDWTETRVREVLTFLWSSTTPTAINYNMFQSVSNISICDQSPETDLWGPAYLFSDFWIILGFHPLPEFDY